MLPLNFPEPEVDETLHSLLIHAFRLSGYANFRNFTEALFGRPSDGRGWSWRFEKIGKYLDSCKLTGRALLQGTLLLPYLMPFMSPEAAKIGENRLDGGHKTGDPGNRPVWHITNNRPLKYCPLCARLHLRRSGRSMWLRCHQLDGVNVCWRHAVSLVQVSQARSIPLLPHEFPDQAVQYDCNSFDLWLAKQAKFLLQSSYAPTATELRKMVYRAQAARVGYGKETRIDYFQIASHLLRRFDRKFVKRILGSSDIEYVTRIVYRTINGGDIGIRPNNHILCIEVLFGEQRNFFQSLREHTQQDLSGSDNYPIRERDDSATARLHKKIFLEELALSGRDVMIQLNRKFPLTHTWIIAHALRWSRRRLSAKSLLQ